MVSIKRMKTSIRWYIKDTLRKPWAGVWLCIFVLTVIIYLSNFWMKSLLDSAQINGSMYAFDQRQFYDQWGKNRTDYQWLVNYVSSRRTDIPTFVVEEHYEVVKYWFQAAELGLLPRSRNILLHIDGHIDAAFPEDDQSIPWFRFPRNEEEVHNMMQRNDMFIVAAALTGFIDHVIWVWPTWVANSDEEEEKFEHAIFDVYLGTARMISSTGGGYENDLCACLKKRSFPEEVEDTKEWMCRRKNKTVIDMENGLPIDTSLCEREADGVLEFVSESLAANVLAKHKWSTSKKVLLDIDEDYFGCWSDVIRLYEIGISQENLNVLSDLVSYLFCVSTAEEEQLADRFYFSLLSLMKTLKSKSCANEEFQSERCLRNVEIENFIILNMEEIERFFMQNGLSEIVCESGTKVRGLFLQSLMSYLMNFSIKQMTALSELGICLDVSPPSIHFPSNGKFHLCHGDNIPNKTHVSFYMPDESEVNFRALKLRRILSSLDRQPDMISICRSVRDGYTPKNLFDTIEKKIMQIIHAVYRQTHSSYVHYDANLLGGKVGWSSRSQPFVHPLLKFLNLS